MNAASEIVTDGQPRVEGSDPRGRRYTPGLSDGLGERVLLFDPETSSSYELLRFRREFTDTPGFEAALRASVDELLRFHHPSFADVSSVEHLGPGEGIALVSHHVAGRRLSEILTKAKGAVFARELIQQLTPALAALQEAAATGVSHGLLTPERIAVTREGRLVILEHVVGSAIETLRLPARRLRSELGIAIESTDAPVISRRADVIQLALVSLSLLIGRRIDAADYPADIVPLIDEAVAGDPAALRLRPWLERALQLTTPAFASAADALVALKELPDESQNGSAPVALMSLRAPVRPFSAASLEAAAVAVEPATKPIIVETVVVEPVAAKPVVAKPVAAKPVVATPVVAKSSVVEPPVAEPVVSKPSVVEPAMVKPVAVRSVLEPVVTEPIVKPLVAEEVTVKPVVAEPIVATAKPVRPAAQAEFRTPDSTASDSRAERAAETEEPEAPARKANWTTVGLIGLAVAQAAVIAALIYVRPASGGPTIVVASPEAPASTPVGLVPGSSSPTDAVAGSILGLAGASPATPLATSAAQPDPSKTETPAASSGPKFGGISLSSPIDVQIFEGDRLVGSTTGGPIALAEGKHTVEAVNEALGFRTRLSIDVKAGQMTAVSITAPNGRLSVNATPWATVSLNGRVLGDTPLANISVPIGHHEIVFRNPEFGEQRQTVAVKTEGLTRVSANFQR